MSLFNRFIAIFSIFVFCAFGFLAIQSTQTDFYRIDKALGLLGNKVPQATLTAKAIPVEVVANPDDTAKQLIKNSFAASAQAVIAQVRSFLANLKNILNNVIDIINQFISALKYIGSSLSMFNNFASIATMAADGRFDQAIRAGIGLAQDVAQIPANVNNRVQDIKDSWAQLVSAEVALRQGNGAQAGLSEPIIKNAKANLFTEMANVREEANNPSTSGSSSSSSSSSSGATPPKQVYTYPLTNLMQDNGTNSITSARKYGGVEVAAQFEQSVQQATETSEAIQEQVEAGKASQDCPAFLGRKGDNSSGSIVPLPNADGSGTIKPLPNANGGGSIVPIPNATNGFLGKVVKGLKQVEPSSLDQSQCELAKSKIKVITDLDKDTGEPNEFSSTVSAILELVNEVQALIQDVQDIIEQVQQIVNLVKSAVNSFSDFGKVFGGISGGGSGSSNSNLDLNSKTIDDGSVLVDASAFLTNSDLFDQYSNQSGDCILDSIKSKTNNYTNNYLVGGNNLRTNVDQRPSLYQDNSKTKTNGTNVYDAVLGATARNGNTPGIKVKKTSDSEVKLLRPNQDGETKTTPGKSFISQSRAKGNANITYHTCQDSPWENNNPDLAAQRMAYYTNTDEWHQAYHDGLSDEWRVVNNYYRNDIPQECYIWKNASQDDLLRVAREIGAYNNIPGTEQSAIDRAKGAIEEAQTKGRVRWNPDAQPGEAYAKSGVMFKVGDNLRNVDLPNGPCEQNYNQQQIDDALRKQGWNIGTAEIKSFVDLTK
ncbi:MAG: hypothetical protein OHK0017_11730 [Patescibacteria group bacterium]